jgi:hypothetical protein
MTAVASNMTAVASNLLSDSPALLPPREAPYLLQDIYELIRDDCRSQLILQLSDGYLLFRADEDSDSLCFEFHPGEFEPSPDHVCFGANEKLTRGELEILKALDQGRKSKQQLGATAKILGAITREGFGKQGGGLAKRGLIAPTGKRMRGSIHYQITAAGRKALAAAVTPWKKLLGKEIGWTWVAINQQGYCDSIMLSFDGIIPTVLLHVIASSIEVFSIAR